MDQRLAPDIAGINVGKEQQIDIAGHLAVEVLDLMFEGIQTALKSKVQRSILAAARQLGKDALEHKLLKILFLVKYVNEFKPSIRN